jgi:hypothetical protein
MANTITAGNATNGGTAISSDTSGILELKTGSTPTTALTIDASQNVSISSISGTVIATQANQETATSTTTIVTPGRQQFHPSAAKAWVMFEPSAAINASYNVSSITDLGTGTWRVVFTNAQSSASFSTVVGAESSSDVWGQVYPAGSRTTTYVGVGTVLGSRSLFDPNHIYAQIFGDLS